MTYNIIVRAAHRRRVTSAAAAHTDNADGGAVEAKESINGTQYDAEQASQKVSRTRGALSHRSISAKCYHGRYIESGLTEIVCWQHWMGPVLHEPADWRAAKGPGVATARRGRASRVAAVNFMMKVGCAGCRGVGRIVQL